LQAARVHVEPAIGVSYVGTALGLAEEGLGIAIVPGYARALVNPAKATWKPLTRPQSIATFRSFTCPSGPRHQPQRR
jgi:hypothetical protein